MDIPIEEERGEGSRVPIRSPARLNPPLTTSHHHPSPPVTGTLCRKSGTTAISHCTTCTALQTTRGRTNWQRSVGGRTRPNYCHLVPFIPVTIYQHKVNETKYVPSTSIDNRYPPIVVVLARIVTRPTRNKTYQLENIDKRHCKVWNKFRICC